MAKLRYARILLSILFLITAITTIVVDYTDVLHFCQYSKYLQIIPSLLPAMLGVIIFWFVTTLLFGRIYCSSICPIGTLLDIFIRLRRFIPQLNRPYSFKPVQKKQKYVFLFIYIFCLILGIGVIPAIIEPWSMFENIISSFNPTPLQEDTVFLSINIIGGFFIGFISFVVIVIYAALKSRDYCNEICPIGTILGEISRKSILHIEINPDKCINCMECESNCKSSCIKVISRYVDDTRCVRCFNCISICPNDAIRYQNNRNRVSTPLMQRVGNSISKIEKQ